MPDIRICQRLKCGRLHKVINFSIHCWAGIDTNENLEPPWKLQNKGIKGKKKLLQYRKRAYRKAVEKFKLHPLPEDCPYKEEHGKKQGKN